MDEPDVKVIRGGVGTAQDRKRFPTPTAVITHRGCKLVIRFEGEDDTEGEGPLHSVEILPGDEALEPPAVRQFVPQFPRYLAYAQAAMRILGDRHGIPDEARWERFTRAAEPLRSLGGAGRALPPEFFRHIADEYRELVGDGEPHPVKAIGDRHVVTISAASRWVTEARRRGFLEPKGRG